MTGKIRIMETVGVLGGPVFPGEVGLQPLQGLIPICASCKKIRDDKGYWNQIEAYISERSSAEFSHSICPECAKKIYPRYTKE